ncbi:MAG TPA: N-formylglutamate amidohydrolase [Sphingomicrobium sp.]|nr:N-formylglutamate amidohydrolase [Sphingomicrobium sp.]
MLLSPFGTSANIVDRTPLPPPLLLPGRASLPVLLSVAHAGRDYPDWLLAQSRRGRASLEPLEDPLVDRLAWRALALGVPGVVARAPRAAIDCNRGPHEINRAASAVPQGEDPGLRARAGLGLIPTRTAKHGDLWRGPVGPAELKLRMQEAYVPFHSGIREGLDALLHRHGAALLLDCHSMPARGSRMPAVVIGDRHGTSATSFLSAHAGRIVRNAGFSVAFNDPYAGGWIAGSHGSPAVGRHVLQIEIDRGEYLDAKLREPGPGFDRVARLLERLAAELGDALAHAVLPAAAE